MEIYDDRVSILLRNLSDLNRSRHSPACHLGRQVERDLNSDTFNLLVFDIYILTLCSICWPHILFIYSIIWPGPTSHLVFTFDPDDLTVMTLMTRSIISAGILVMTMCGGDIILSCVMCLMTVDVSWWYCCWRIRHRWLFVGWRWHSSGIDYCCNPFNTRIHQHPRWRNPGWRGDHYIQCCRVYSCCCVMMILFILLCVLILCVISLFITARLMSRHCHLTCDVTMA